MLRYTICGVLASLVLLAAAPAARADDDDWDDYREWLEEQRERQRERHEDWLEAQREAREEYRERMEDWRDSQRRLNPRWNTGRIPRAYGDWTPASPPATWYPAPMYYSSYQPYYGGYDYYRPGGFNIRGPRGRVFSVQW